MEELCLYLLGSPRLERRGHVVEMDTRKALALLALVALEGQEQQRDTLTALLYPEADPVSARAAFRRTLSTLHGALGDGVLAIRRDAVGLAASSGLWVDALHFRELATETASLERLEQAASLYQGDFMAGFSLRDSPSFDEWQYQQTEELRRRLVTVLDQLVNRMASSSDFTSAIQHAARRAALDPLLEDGHRQLMELYARAGQRGAALRQYRECVRILEQELGVAPLEETTHLYQEIMSGRLEPARTPEQPFRGPGRESAPAEIRPAPAAIPLVGRDAEIAHLTRAFETAPSALFISLEGEAGVGKTRMAEELVTLARRQGRAVAQARCYEGQAGLAYGPILDALGPVLEAPECALQVEQLAPSVLAEAARLLPGLAARGREPLPVPLADGPGAQTRFMEALRLLTNSLLGGPLPGLLFIDDLQWADAASLDLLTYLARRAALGAYHLLIAWRSQEGANQERLRRLQAEQQRAGHALHLSLRRLTRPEIGALARSLLGDAAARLEERLFRESEGLPFIALEYLHSFEQAGGEWKLPGGVRELLHQRLQSPAEAARQLLTAAAVIGRSFDFSTLQAVSGRSEMETIDGLEELMELGLVQEDPTNGYDFTHEKLRQVAYDETSLARRRLLHLRAGETLAAEHALHDLEANAGAAANHFLQAGQPGRAAEYFRQAGEYARRLHANSEALAHFQAALAAGHPNPAGLHEASGDLYTLQGEYAAAVASYQAAAAFCTPDCLSNLMHKLGEVYHRRGEWEAAESHYQAALEASGKDASPEWLAHLFADWSLTAYRAAQPARAAELAQNALDLAQQSDSPAALAQAYNMLGILERARDQLEEAGNFFERSLAAAGEQEDLSLRAAALHNLARLEQERGRHETALPLALQALETCTLLGDRHHQAALLNTLADLHHAAGREDQAMTHLKQAVTLFTEIGEEPGTALPEIWKLTEW
jgi:DNA-binding SARP family transcriptional activator